MIQNENHKSKKKGTNKKTKNIHKKMHEWNTYIYLIFNKKKTWLNQNRKIWTLQITANKTATTTKAYTFIITLRNQ